MRVFLAATLTGLALLGLAGCGDVSERISRATGTTQEVRCVGYLILGRSLLATADARGWASDTWAAFSEAGREYHRYGCGPVLGQEAPWPAVDGAAAPEQ